MDNIFFDEIQLYDDIVKVLKEELNTEDNIEMFGDREITFYDSLDISEPHFPAVYIEISNNPVDNMRTSNQVELYSRFDIIIETFTEQVEVNGNITSKERLGITLNKMIKEVIAKHYRLNCTGNRPIPNIDSSIHRRQINYSGIVDNKTKMIYNI